MTQRQLGLSPSPFLKPCPEVTQMRDRVIAGWRSRKYLNWHWLINVLMRYLETSAFAISTLISHRSQVCYRADSVNQRGMQQIGQNMESCHWKLKDRMTTRSAWEERHMELFWYHSMGWAVTVKIGVLALPVLRSCFCFWTRIPTTCVSKLKMDLDLYLTQCVSVLRSLIPN